MPFGGNPKRHATLNGSTERSGLATGQGAMVALTRAAAYCGDAYHEHYVDNHKDYPKGAKAKCNVAEGLRFFGSVLRARHITGRDFLIYLRGKDDCRDRQRPATEY